MKKVMITRYIKGRINWSKERYQLDIGYFPAQTYALIRLLEWKRMGELNRKTGVNKILLKLSEFIAKYEATLSYYCKNTSDTDRIRELQQRIEIANDLKKYIEWQED